MKLRFATAFLVLTLLSGCAAIPAPSTAPIEAAAPEVYEDELLELSRQKWLWMAERDVDRLAVLFHPDARFVHMGGTMDSATELEIIRGGQIQYRQADISEHSVEVIGDTAIVYSRLRLLAVVGGNEVTNPFSVTETYVREGESWRLVAMAFTRMLGD